MTVRLVSYIRIMCNGCRAEQVIDSFEELPEDWLHHEKDQGGPSDWCPSCRENGKTNMTEHICNLPGTYQAQRMASSDRDKSWQCVCGRWWHTEFETRSRTMMWVEGSARAR